MKVLVLGGGIVGITTAYYLQRLGHEVTLIDRQPEIAMECSFANGGFIATGQAIPWSAPGAPLKILKTFGRQAAPILLRPSQIPRMWRWGVEFLWCCRRETSWQNTGHVLRLSLYSAAALDDFQMETGIAYDRRAAGSLKIYSKAKVLDAAALDCEAQRAWGLNFQVVDRSDCLTRVPGLRPVIDTLEGGIFFPDEQSGDCRKFALAIADHCRRQGVEFRLNTEIEALEGSGDRVTGVRTNQGQLTADHYVLSLGAYSPIVARSIGIRLPIYPLKGYSMTVPSAAWPGAPQIPVLDEERKFGLTPFDDRLRLTGFAEAAGYDTRPRQRRLKAFIEAILSLFPELRPSLDVARLEALCGLRPVTPNGPPILGQSRYHNLVFNTGQGHLGWTMACGSAKLVADIVDGRPPELDMTGYSIGGR